MKVWIRLAGGILLLLLGVLWSLQGSGATGSNAMSGGMSGHSMWLVIGLIVAVAGVVLLASATIKLRAGRRG